MADVLYLDIEELIGDNKNLDYKIQDTASPVNNAPIKKVAMPAQDNKLKDLVKESKKINDEIKKEGIEITDGSKQRDENSDRPFLRD